MWRSNTKPCARLLLEGAAEVAIGRGVDHNSFEVRRAREDAITTKSIKSLWSVAFVLVKLTAVLKGLHVERSGRG
jgi:hypothetical protein